MPLTPGLRARLVALRGTRQLIRSKEAAFETARVTFRSLRSEIVVLKLQEKADKVALIAEANAEDGR